VFVEKRGREKGGKMGKKKGVTSGREKGGEIEKKWRCMRSAAEYTLCLA